MVIPDSGFRPGADTEHTWLRGAGGEPENPIGGYPPRSPTPATGRSWPASREPWHRALRCGWTRPSPSRRDLRADLDEDSRRARPGRGGHLAVVRHLQPDGFRCSDSRSWRSGCGARPDRPGGGGGQRLDQEPFWPWPWTPWVVGVGLLNADRDGKASVEQRRALGGCLAPGEGLVNALPRSTTWHRATERGRRRKSTALAHWSGTSFSTPLSRG